MRRPPCVSLHRSVEGCRGGSYPGDRLIRDIKDGDETRAKLFVRGGSKSTHPQSRLFASNGNLARLAQADWATVGRGGEKLSLG